MNALELNISQLRPFVWVLNDSQYISRKKGLEKFIDCCPIFSENRSGGNIVFTIVPYAKPDFFELESPLPIEMSKEELTSSLARNVIERQSFSLGALGFAKDEIGKIRLEMNLSCKRPNTHVIDFIDDNPPGKVLDLGSGIGSNAIALLKKGWDVTAMDKQEESLSILLKTTQHFRNKPKVILNNLTRADLGDSLFDLIISIDTLPYTPLRDILLTMKKIRDALKPNGIFIATLFFAQASAKNENHIKAMNLLGAEFLKDPRLVHEILRHSGFEVLKINYRIEDDLEPAAIEVTGRKTCA
jgi:SAM-dependent methyltransferase